MGVETALAIGIPLAIAAVGTLAQSGNRSDISAAGAQKMSGMQDASRSYAGYRNDQADARMKALDQQMGMFKGAGNILNAMYGGSGASSGGYTPGSGGWKPGDPGTTPGVPTDMTGGAHDPRAPYYPKGGPIDPTTNGTPPIISKIPEGPAAGSSGPMLTGPLPGQNQMLMSLAGPPAAATPTNPMIAGLLDAAKRRA